MVQVSFPVEDMDKLAEHDVVEPLPPEGAPPPPPPPPDEVVLGKNTLPIVLKNDDIEL